MTYFEWQKSYYNFVLCILSTSKAEVFEVYKMHNRYIGKNFCHSNHIIFTAIFLFLFCLVFYAFLEYTDISKIRCRPAEKRTIMTLHELYKMINLQPLMIEKLDKIAPSMDMDFLEDYLVRLMNRETTEDAYDELDKMFADDPENIKMLYCQMECARRIYDRYQEKQIPDQIFVDTMGCFQRFNEECLVRYGKMYFDRGWWTYRQIRMSEFRIGQLEYEFEKHAGKDMIYVHIPSDADFSPESVSASLAMAKEFFAKYYPDYSYEAFICESWLLGSDLYSLLPETSNIVSFHDRFEIIEEEKEGSPYYEWVYKVPSGTPISELPENTSLQCSIKRHLENGGTMGGATGILKHFG